MPAEYHCHIRPQSRKSGSACASLSYIIGEPIKEERSGEVKYYPDRRERIIAKATLLPAGAPKEWKEDPGLLWNAQDKWIDANNPKASVARVALIIEFALPRGLTRQQWKWIVESFIKNNITSEGYACTYAIHNSKDGTNPHVHIQMTQYTIDKKTHDFVRSAAKSVFALDEAGNRVPVIDPKTGKQKVRVREGKGMEKCWKRTVIDQNLVERKEYLLRLRKAVADECNRFLPESEWMSHLSLKDRGINRKPTIHIGPKAQALERKGIATDKVTKNRTIKLGNLIQADVDGKARLISPQQNLIEDYSEDSVRIPLDDGEKLQIPKKYIQKDFVVEGHQLMLLPHKGKNSKGEEYDIDYYIISANGKAYTRSLEHLVATGRITPYLFRDLVQNRTAPKNDTPERQSRPIVPPKRWNPQR